MAIFKIDGLLDVADQRYRIALEGVDYFLRILYLDRSRSFYLSLDDADEVAIQHGVRMVTGYPLFLANRDPRKQLSGDFYAIAVPSDGSSTFDLEELTNGTLTLYYGDADDLFGNAIEDATPLTVTPA